MNTTHDTTHHNASTVPAIDGDHSRHRPVLAREVVTALRPRSGGLYVDGTFGDGGYAQRLLAIEGTRVVGIDRDPEAIAVARSLSAHHDGRLIAVKGCFSQMPRLLNHLGVRNIDGVVFDLGVSSRQLDDPKRGFSFRHDGPLDMRMSRDGSSAADLVNTVEHEELSAIIRMYGEERMANRVARAIVTARQQQPIRSTRQLATIIRHAVGGRRTKTGRAAKIDPATKTFQALRIHVNDEMTALDHGLHAAETLLLPGGRLAVVSFHSLEDRTVKTFLRQRAGLSTSGTRHRPSPVYPDPSFHLHTRRAIKPTDDELKKNRRARSARLRWAERTSAPAWPVDGSREGQHGFPLKREAL